MSETEHPSQPPSTQLTQALQLTNKEGEIHVLKPREAEESRQKTREELERRIEELTVGLQESESQLNHLLEGSVQGILIHRDDKALFVNQSFVEMYGYETPDEIYSLETLLSLIEPTERERLIHSRDARLAGEYAPDHYEYQGIRRDGSRLWLDMRARVVNWAGEPATQTIVRDITEHKQGGRALRESEMRFRALAEHSLAGVYIFQDGRYQYINPRFAEIFGYTPAEILTEHGDSLALIAEEDLEFVRAKVRERLRGEAKNLHYCFHGKRKNGESVDIEVLGTVIEWGGRQAITGTLFDITERKRIEQALQLSEKRLNLVLDATSDGIWDWNIATGEVLFSPNWFTSLGYKVGELPPHFSSWEAIVHPDDMPRTQEALAAHFAGQTPFYECENRLLTKEGIYRWNLDRGQVVMRDDQGNPVRMVGTDTDITERKHLEAQLRQAQKMEAMGTLAGGIAHEFNNILSTLLIFTELAQSEVPRDSTTWDYLKQVAASGDRAKDLVQKILAFSRHSETKREPVKLNAIVKESLQLLRATLPATIAIVEDLGAVTGTVLVSPTEIHQILMNLCANAEHTMRETGGQLGIQLDSVEIDEEHAASHPNFHAGPYIRLTVSDTGHGIPPEVQERIFEPFFTTKSVGEGTGLGLSVIHGIVADCGGAMTVESLIGTGTTFEIYLPEVTETAAAKTNAPESHIPLGRERILVVDDDPAICHGLDVLLQRLGYEPTSTTSSRDALACFQMAPDAFDLVITDQTMPELTGEELTKQLRQIRPDIPIILTTGFSHVMDAAKAESLGINAFMMKPFMKDVLHRTIEQVVSSRPRVRRATGSHILLIDDDQR